MTTATMKFGRYEGQPLMQVPAQYLQWVVKNSDDREAVEAAETELARRTFNFLSKGRR